VLSTGLGQNPARQVALFSKLQDSTTCYTLNKVCASGLKSIDLGATSIALGEHDCVTTGGIENMTQAPHFAYMRSGTAFGDISFKDPVLHDGLTDVYNKFHMGLCGENISQVRGISRDDQDAYAKQS